MGVVMVNNVTKIIAYTGAKLLKPCASNGVFLHCWSPGYKISKEVVEPNGAKKIKKIFVPTSTFEAAVAHLKNEYGAKEYLKFKEDVHPGHIAVETSTTYLSVGTNDEFNLIGAKTQHPICFIEKLEKDLISFKRAPEKILDFYTLDVSLIEKVIHEFKTSKLLYSLLGNRLYKNEGESCATSAFIALEAGGIENLLSVDQWLLTKYGILTPSLLTSYADKARNQELSLFPEIIPLSTEVLSEKQRYIQQVLSIFKKIDNEMQNDIPNIPNQRGLSK